MRAQRLATAVVHHAGSGADLGVDEAGHVLFEEVEQAPFTLEERKQLQRGVDGRQLRHWIRLERRGERRGERREIAGGQRAAHSPRARGEGRVE